VTTGTGTWAALSNLQGYVLLAVDHEGNRRSHASGNARLEFQQLLTLIRRIGVKGTARGLEHDVTARRNGAAADGRAAGNAPALGARGRVVRNQEAPVGIGADRFERRAKLGRRPRGSRWCGGG